MFTHPIFVNIRDFCLYLQNESMEPMQYVSAVFAIKQICCDG